MRDKLAPVIKQESFLLKLVTEKEPFLSEKTLSEAEMNRLPYLFSLLDCSLSHHACAVVIQLCPAELKNVCACARLWHRNPILSFVRGDVLFFSFDVLFVWFEPRNGP